jgi:hypothetical protein
LFGVQAREALILDDEADATELIVRSATRNGAAPDVVQALIALEATFFDFTVFGSKANFARRVAQILDEAANRPET